MKKIFMTLLETVRQILFRTTAIGFAVRESKLNYEYNKKSGHL